MPIEVELPDGNIVEFPDGTDNATMERALASYMQPNFSNVQSGASSTNATKPRGSTDTGIGRLISGKPQQRGNAVTRALGDLGGRQVLQGTLGTFGALGGDAVNQTILAPVDRAIGWGDQLGVGDRTYREAASDLADRLGMAAPQTSGQRIASDVGEGLAGTALTMGLGGLLNAGRSAVSTAAPTIRTRLADLLTAQPVLQGVSAAAGAGASSMARESGASTGGQLLAGIAGGLTPGAMTTLGGATARGLVRGVSGDKMQNSISDFASLGATPSAGQASGRGWVQGLEGLLSKGPTSSGVMGKFAERQAESIGRGLQNKAEALSPDAGSENAGLAIERGMQSFKGDTSSVKRALYWAVDKQIPANTPTPMANTVRTLARLTTPNPAAPATTGALIQPRIAQLRGNLEADLQAGGGSLTYEALKQIRSDVGEAINNSSPLNPSSDLRELQQLYGSLSEDMLAAAKSRGPRAVLAAQRANKYTRDVANRMELVQRVIDKNGGPERIFQAAMSGTNDGATTLRGVMFSLPKAEQQAVSAAVIKRMGMAVPNAQDMGGDLFSASTFMTNWNKLSPEAKKVLFGRYGSGFKESMDRIARVSDNIKKGSKVFSNPSGSGDKTAAYAYWAGLLGALGSGRVWTATGIAGGGALANVTSRVLTSPKAVKFLANSTAIPMGSLSSQISVLGRIANESGDDGLLALYELAQGAPEGEQGDPNATSNSNN